MGVSSAYYEVGVCGVVDADVIGVVAEGAVCGGVASSDYVGGDGGGY